MLNRDRKRKKSTFTLSSVTNDFINDLSTQRGINKSKLVDEAISFYYQNINCPPIPVEVINNDLPILPIKEVELLHTTYEEEVKECPPTNPTNPTNPNNKHWEYEEYELDEIEFDQYSQSVDTNDTRNTEYTLQEQGKEMQFRNFEHLMNESEKYEIKGAKLVLKEEYKEQEDAKVNAPITTMSSLIALAQESGLSLKH